MQEFKDGTDPTDPNDYLGEGNTLRFLSLIFLIIGTLFIVCGIGYLVYKKMNKTEEIIPNTNTNFVPVNRVKQNMNIKQEQQRTMIKDMMNKKLEMQKSLINKRNAVKERSRLKIFGEFDNDSKETNQTDKTESKSKLKNISGNVTSLNKVITPDYHKKSVNDISSRTIMRDMIAKKGMKNPQIISHDNMTIGKLDSIIKDHSSFSKLETIFSKNKTGDIHKQLNDLSRTQKVDLLTKLDSIAKKGNFNSLDQINENNKGNISSLSDVIKTKHEGDFLSLDQINDKNITENNNNNENTTESDTIKKDKKLIKNIDELNKTKNSSNDKNKKKNISNLDELNNKGENK